jgi:uncharacterized protein
MAPPQQFYFGPAESRLFGVYHAPQAVADRDVGVLVCPPIGREYLKTHRALRQLAVRLARAGFHALRFDYRGCGDSAGDPAGATLAEWAADVGHAADELKDRAGLGRVALVGLRLGATLALLSAGTRRDVEGLVLWEPVVDGAAYLAGIRADHAARTRGRVVDDGPLEWSGFPVGLGLQEGLASLAPLPGRRPARRALILRDHEAAADAALLDGLRGLGVAAERVETAMERIWLDEEDVGRALVPSTIFQKAVGWLEAGA